MKSGSSGPWDLPLEGLEVLEITFANPVDIVAYGDAGVDAMIRFEGNLPVHRVRWSGPRSRCFEELVGDVAVVLARRDDRLPVRDP